jgi:8-oxo-dGTP diphosphatase
VSRFDIEISVSEGGVAALAWIGTAGLDELTRALGAAASDALSQGGIRRLEISLPATDHAARRAVLRAGFRLEGIRRQALPTENGSYGDEMIFARLATDQVAGPIGFSAVMNSALPRKRLIAHVLIRDDRGRVLLCETQFKPDWELPGGIVEPGEAPRLGAVREVREELGIELAVGRLLVVDWLPPYLGWDDAIEMIFDGGTVAEPELDTWSLQPTEIKKVALVDLDTAAVLLTPLAHRRLAIATSLEPGQMAYTEDGSRLG